MKIRLATRNSPLALYQAQHVKNILIRSHPHLDVVIMPQAVDADAIQSGTLRDHGGKDLFVAALQNSLLNSKADIAVHSVKDLPAVLPPKLLLASIVERIDSRDVVIASKPLVDLSAGAVVATSSLRRLCQLRLRYPHLNWCDIRGNIETRLQKLADGECEALILAAAALIRLNKESKIMQYLHIDHCVPAAAQGAIGVEVCKDNDEIVALLTSIEDKSIALCVRWERQLCALLGASCHSALGVHVRLTDDAHDNEDTLLLSVMAANPKTKEYIRLEEICTVADAQLQLETIAERLLRLGVDRWLR